MKQVPIEETEKRYRGPYPKELIKAKGEVISRWRKELVDRLQTLGVAADEVAAPSGEEGEKTVAFLEKVLSAHDDLISVRFLQRGAEVTRAVCRVETFDEAGEHLAFGSGFLVAPGVLLTNNHLLPSEASARTCELQFGYDAAGMDYVVFKAATQALFTTSEELDYTLVAVAERSSDDAVDIVAFDPVALSPKMPRLGQEMNIVQHPGGEPKQIAIRDNEIVDVLDDFIHYRTDTRQGSSGAPVCNDDWQVVALHHSGVPRRKDGQILDLNGGVWDGQDINQIDFLANEGVRIERILVQAVARADGNDPALMKVLEGLRDQLSAGAPARATRRARTRPPRRSGGTIPQAMIGGPDLFNPAVQAAAVDLLDERRHPILLPEEGPDVGVTASTAEEEAKSSPAAPEPDVHVAGRAVTTEPIRVGAGQRVVKITIPLQVEVALGEPPTDGNA
jgi:V8-like Glu-specific endopeptidase